MSESKKKNHHTPAQVLYVRSSPVVLPESYTLQNGFLLKGNTLVSLAASGLVEMAAQGFIHVDATNEYKTK